ncbi:sensor histidine kinase [Poritiphilus flavus]|uniref:Sensor histidine kinase n=1 Tax=Poritiphilus flavus TaxID=2697053 RepID=A0A6L9EGE5_9FLAO|nr:histidine kinase [Poritiphilus flavus]NAS13319.1 sensor histidine kinase [Poritiphilus flavus]
MFILTKTYEGWSLERVSRHIGYWLLWWLFYMVINEGVFDNGSYREWFLFELHVLPLKWSITYFTIYYLFPKYVRNKRYLTFFFWILGLIIVGGILFRALDYYVIGNLISSEALLKKIDSQNFWSFTIAYKALDLLFVVSLVLIIKFIQLQTLQESKNKELTKQKLEAELNYLKHQLQPHFLFNTLNNLYGMIITKDENAGEIVLKLSDILSYMLYNSNDKEISLEKELESLANYIELEKLRYGKELTVSYEVTGSPQDHKIAPLILISFVENAFKHGPSDVLVDSWIRIAVHIEDEQMRFEVENSMETLAVDKDEKQGRVVSGIGLSNIEKRLELIYGDSYELHISEGDTYKVELTIKKHELSYSG